MRTLFCLMAIFAASELVAQPYVDGGHTRHRFAQLNAGISFYHIPTGNSNEKYIDDDGTLLDRSLPSSSQVRLTIGGIHFWGHTDFYLSFPITSIGKSGFTPSVETGAKYYPWRLEDKKLRPFIGFAWMPYSYSQGNGTEALRHGVNANAGITHTAGKSLFELGINYLTNARMSYYISPSIRSDIQLPNLAISLTYKRTFETTLSAEDRWKSGKAKVLTDTLSKLGRLNGFTLSVGPSSSAFLNAKKQNKDQPYLDRHVLSPPFPEFGLGYYYHPLDLQANLNYRHIKSRLSAYGLHQSAERRAIGLEVYHFFADYHGFVPFIGPVLDYNILLLKERGIRDQKWEQKVIKPGLVFGWDIRPDELQGWYLRTNLRWVPNLSIEQSGSRFTMDQLEVNFIQLVVFPGRFI